MHSDALRCTQTHSDALRRNQTYRIRARTEQIDDQFSLPQPELPKVLGAPAVVGRREAGFHIERLDAARDELLERLA